MSSAWPEELEDSAMRYKLDNVHGLKYDLLRDEEHLGLGFVNWNLVFGHDVYDPIIPYVQRFPL